MAEGLQTKIRQYDLSFHTRSATGTTPPDPPWTHNVRTDVRTDYVIRGGSIKDWRRKIARCEGATTPLVGERYYVLSEPGYYHRLARSLSTGVYTLHERYGDMCNATVNDSLPSYTSSIDADNQAKMRFVNKAIDAQRAIQGGVVLGELRETLRMIRHPAQALRRRVDDYFNALKKRRRGSQQVRRRTLSETWLEHSFGWTPFLNDISDAGKYLDRLLYQPEFKSIKAGGMAETPYPNSEYVIGYVAGGVDGRFNRQQKSRTIVVYRGAVKLDMSDKPSFARSQAGLTIHDFVPTLWEIVPYSFLVDYFTNIGDILEAWSFGRHGIRWSNKTIIEISSVELVGKSCSIVPGTNQPLIDSGFHLGRHTVERRRIERAVYSGSFIPDFRFEIPGFDNKRWINLAALARSRRSLTPF